MENDRRRLLEEYLAAHPGEAFARYGLAMELTRAGDADAALREFARLQAEHPDYAAAYQQAGQLLIALGRGVEARSVLEEGIAAANRAGALHASQEMTGLLQEIG